jgi:hypothetical protein
MALWIDSNNQVHDEMDGASLELPSWPKGMSPYTMPAPTTAEIVNIAKASKIASLSKSCQDYIYAGFTSNALGSTYTYPANDKDQTNLAARVLSSLYPNLPASWTTSFLCCDTSGVWGYVSHTAAQIQQVGADANAYIASALVKNNTLSRQVNAINNTSTTALTDLAAIVW